MIAKFFSFEVFGSNTIDFPRFAKFASGSTIARALLFVVHDPNPQFQCYAAFLADKFDLKRFEESLNRWDSLAV